jgi:polyhydroxybutyrate depolymerase
VPATFDGWSEREGCDGVELGERPDRADDGAHVVVHEATGCDAGTAVELLEVVGGGHTWPGREGGPSRAVVGRATSDVDGVDETWTFVSTHPRRG